MARTSVIAAVVALAATACSVTLARSPGENPRGAEQSVTGIASHEPAPNPALPKLDPNGETLVLPGEEGDAQLMSADRLFFDVPNRPAYRNTFDRSADLDDIRYVPGNSNVAVDVTTRLGANSPVVMLSFAIVNKNPSHLLFDSTMTIYADANGAPDVDHPIGVVAANSLWAPGNSALGVARLYLGQPSPFTLPPGRLWFGVEISNVRGGDPQLFGQIVATNVTAGASTGTLLDLGTTPPTVVALPGGPANLDRVIIPQLDCRPDWDMNQTVNVMDFMAFINEFRQNPTDADYNTDGVTDVRDYGSYILDYLHCIE